MLYARIIAANRWHPWHQAGGPDTGKKKDISLAPIVAAIDEQKQHMPCILDHPAQHTTQYFPKSNWKTWAKSDRRGKMLKQTAQAVAFSPRRTQMTRRWRED
jgi:hypothetical protein